MSIKFSHLNHILAVDRAGSFARAAEEEGITQPALSHSIANFEQDFAVRLFDRGRGGVALTPAGTMVVEQARQILSATDDLERSLQLYGKGERGRICFGLGPHLASMILPGVSSTLLRDRPGLQIKPDIGPTGQLMNKLHSDQIEFIIGHSIESSFSPRITMERLAELPLAVLARGGHPLAGKKGLHLTDLAPFPVASASELPAGAPIGVGGSLICDNFHILRDVVEQTDCVWISSPTFVANQLANGTLVQLDVTDFSPKQIEFGIISRHDRTRSPAALALIAELKSMLLRYGQP